MCYRLELYLLILLKPSFVCESQWENFVSSFLYSLSAKIEHYAVSRIRTCGRNEFDFHSVFFSNNCFIRSAFSESLGKKFAMNCFSPSKDFSCLDNFGSFKCSIPSFFPLFGVILCSFISYPKQVVSSRKNSDFFTLSKKTLSWRAVSGSQWIGRTFQTSICRARKCWIIVPEVLKKHVVEALKFGQAGSIKIFTRSKFFQKSGMRRDNENKCSTCKACMSSRKKLNYL